MCNDVGLEPLGAIVARLVNGLADRSPEWLGVSPPAVIAATRGSAAIIEFGLPHLRGSRLQTVKERASGAVRIDWTSAARAPRLAAITGGS